MQFASPSGRRPNIDPLSESLVVYFGNWLQKNRDNQLIQRMYAENNLALPRPFPKTLLAGVVDARNSLVEEPGDLAEFGRRLLEELEGDLHFVPNGDLQFVPEKIARQKVLRLGEAARILKEER